MPLYVLPFPAFDPVLISFGPIAIRWYALAYIVGILLGWLYARAIIRRERLWSAPMPMTVSRLRRFRAVGHARHHPGRADRLRTVLQPELFRRAPAGNLPALEGRHVVSWRLSRLRARGRPVRPPSRNIHTLARRHHLRGGTDRDFSSGASPISSTASCGAGRPTCPGQWCFPTAGQCRAIRASSTRRCSRDSAFRCPHRIDPRRRAQAAGLHPRRLQLRLRRRALDLRTVSRA